MFTNMDLIFLRHAQSDYNILKQKLRTMNTKQVDEFLTKLKGSYQIRDSRITENGINQCKQIAETLNWDSIGLIIVSPLKRCLDTCQALLKFSKKKIQVSVQPLICGRVSKIWSVGSSKTQLERSYPQFTFNLLHNNKKIPWLIRGLFIQKHKKLLGLQQPKNFLEYGIKQGFYQFKQRIQQFKRSLKNRLLNLKQGQRILIISHKNVFRMLTAKFFEQKGKCISDYTFSCAQLKYFASSKFFYAANPMPCL